MRILPDPSPPLHFRGTSRMIFGGARCDFSEKFLHFYPADQGGIRTHYPASGQKLCRPLRDWHLPYSYSELSLCILEVENRMRTLDRFGCHVYAAMEYLDDVSSHGMLLSLLALGPSAIIISRLLGVEQIELSPLQRISQPFLTNSLVISRLVISLLSITSVDIGVSHNHYHRSCRGLGRNATSKPSRRAL